ncbi:uncharacterized protein [Eurosta solidaginis]|uniref:uncharacterized protein n=1 Tax=Eurosta solidaginis TaxID=178769 RepID=UPI0035315EEA
MGFRLERQDAEIREMTRALADLDNKLNSPKMRNPFLMKHNTTERCSPNMSPRRGSSTSNVLLQHNNLSNRNRAVAVHAQSQVDNQMKSRLASSSMHVATPDTGSQ